MRNRSLFTLLFVLIFVSLALAACGQAESDLSVSDPWARAATANTMSSGDDMSDDGSITADTATSSMDMEDAEEGMAMSASAGGVSAVYMTIANQGGAADRLVSAATDVAAVVEIHETTMDDAGVMRMRPLSDGLEIPANGSAELEPGGVHIMLMQLQQDLVAGETITLTLTFESGKTLTVEAEVRNS
ncbi:MAG: copper chaperone PCu(A)C [Anaerolineae bacterium]|nr:copper chaperone PCu(A)C [Anaerolineae bacterium]